MQQQKQKHVLDGECLVLREKIEKSGMKYKTLCPSAPSLPPFSIIEHVLGYCILQEFMYSFLNGINATEDVRPER